MGVFFTPVTNLTAVCHVMGVWLHYCILRLFIGIGNVYCVKGHVCIWKFLILTVMLVLVVFLHTFMFLISLQVGMKGLYIILLLTSCVMTQQCLTSEGSLTRSTQYSGVSFHHLQWS